MWTATIVDVDAGSIQLPKLMPPFANRARPKCYPLAAEGSVSSNAAGSVFRRKPTPGLYQGWARVKKTRQTRTLEFRFDCVKTEMILGMIQQVKVRQQVHGEIAAKRNVAVAAVTADSGHLDRALIEMDVVALMSLGC